MTEHTCLVLLMQNSKFATSIPNFTRDNCNDHLWQPGMTVSLSSMMACDGTSKCIRTTHLKFLFELHMWTTPVNNTFELRIRTALLKRRIWTTYLDSTFVYYICSWRICSEKLHADFDAVWLWMISWNSAIHLANDQAHISCVTCVTVPCDGILKWNRTTHADCRIRRLSYT